MNLSEIVNVVISRETANVSQAGFGTLLIVGPNCNLDSRLEYFSTSATALAKITGTSSRESALVEAAFAQNPAPTRIALGSLQASRTAVFTGTFTGGTISALINGRTISKAWTTDLDTTIAALATDIAADADVDTAAYTAGTNTLVITPNTGKVVGVSFVLTAVTGTLAYTITSTELSETYTTALNAILLEQPDWYGVCAETQTIEKQELIADWVESNKKFFFCGSGDSNIAAQASGTDTTSIAYYADSNNLTKTAVFYSTLAATEGIEAAVAGRILPLNPGEYTVKFKTLAAITVNALTDTYSTNVRAKNANSYESVGGVDILAEGTVGSGEFIDVIIFIDWLYARLQENVFAALTKAKKVPYTNSGINAIASAMEEPLATGLARGGISPKEFTSEGVQIGGYVITAPSLSSVPSADKSSRSLNDMKFTAWLAGAIHFVRIDGTVTL